MATDFDDIFAAASGKPAEQPKQTTEKTSAKKRAETRQPDSLPSKPDPWAELEPSQKEATIRLNVDIPIALNDKLADKARKLRKSKSDLVRELLKWALE